MQPIIRILTMKVTFIVFLSSVFLGVAAFASPVNAKVMSDPTVAVIRDITASSRCVSGYRSGSIHTQATCPAGTIVEQVNVLRSEAIKNNEPFVVLPTNGSSTNQSIAFRKQLQALKEGISVSGAISSQTLVRPLTSCGNIGYFTTTYVHNGTNILAQVTVDRHTRGCDLHVQGSTVQLKVFAETFNWVQDQYAASYWEHGNCTPINSLNTIYGWSPPGGVFVTPGYYWEQVFGEHQCYGNTIWDNIGTLN